jgi:hypothetical protein
MAWSRERGMCVMEGDQLVEAYVLVTTIRD